MRLLATESTNKNDPHDARSVAIAALRSPTPKEVGFEDHAAVMKLWSHRHRTLSSSRTQIACRLHAVLCGLVAGGVPDEIYASKAQQLLAGVTPETAVEAARVELAEELVDDLHRVDGQIAESKKRLEQVVAASGTSTIGIFGVGPVVAATVVGVTGDIARFPSRDRFAAYNGTAPIEVSSGGRKVWRLSRRGNRTLNHAIHMAAVTQTRWRHSSGRAYYDRKIAQGKTPQGSDARPQAPHQRRPVGRHGRRRPTLIGHDRDVDGEDGSGRAPRERLCRQRGRLTPRNTGSSAKPLPNPIEDYDHEPALAAGGDSINHHGHTKNCLTNKEGSIWSLDGFVQTARW